MCRDAWLQLPRYFPTPSKNHLSHDILLLCLPCHQLSGLHDTHLRQVLAEEYSAPLNASTARFHDDPQKVKVKKFALALTKAKNLPDTRRKEMEEVVADYFDCEVGELTKEMLESLVAMETRYEIWHGSDMVLFQYRSYREGKLGIENGY